MLKKNELRGKKNFFRLNSLYLTLEILAYFSCFFLSTILLASENK